ncbi:MAG: hypothetical protein ACLUR5_13710 [Eubacterium ventriosum]
MDGTGTILLYTYSAWIQSAEYSDRYPDTLVKKSYNSVGKDKKVDKSIILYASDAAWVYNNCKYKTVLEIVKGSKKDQLPLQVGKRLKQTSIVDGILQILIKAIHT